MGISYTTQLQSKEQPNSQHIIMIVSLILIMALGYANSECIHQCNPTGTCETEARWKDGRLTRWAQGSCFSPRFGGSCSGIPEVCEGCRTACGGRSGRYTTPQVTDDGGVSGVCRFTARYGSGSRGRSIDLTLQPGESWSRCFQSYQCDPEGSGNHYAASSACPLHHYDECPGYCAVSLTIDDCGCEKQHCAC